MIRHPHIDFHSTAERICMAIAIAGGLLLAVVAAVNWYFGA